jgi:hypothetical protein
VSAVWAGLLTFLVPAAVFSWIAYGIAWLVSLDLNFHRTVELLFSLALVTGLIAVLNASWTRITRTTIRLENLPLAWRGRKAALISDVHLGHVRSAWLGKFGGKNQTQFSSPVICTTVQPSMRSKRQRL